jgi:hypothetical protein
MSQTNPIFRKLQRRMKIVVVITSAATRVITSNAVSW